MGKLIFFAQFVLLGLTVCGTGLHYRYLRMLRLSHPTTWQSLGRPTLFWTAAAIMTSFPVLRFLWRREYHTLGDQEFSRLSGWVRAYNFFVAFPLCTFPLLVLLLHTYVRRAI